jgi:hypothetical protein
MCKIKIEHTCNFQLDLTIKTASVVRGCRGRNRIVVGFTTTCAISAYHHWCCELESRLERGLQYYVIKFASDLKQVGGLLRDKFKDSTNTYLLVNSIEIYIMY